MKSATASATTLRTPSARVYRFDRAPPLGSRIEVLDGLAAAGESVLVVGAPGTGKTTVAVGMLSSVATGKPFLSRHVFAGSAVYVAAEKPREAERRLNALLPAGAPVYVTRVATQLAETEEVDELIADIRAALSPDAAPPVRLIVLDTLARCMVGSDENSSRDMGLVVRGMDRLLKAFPDAVLVAIHHTARGQNHARGSTALEGAVDLILASTGGKARRSLQVIKANAIDTEQPGLAFRLVPLDTEDGSVITMEASPDDEDADDRGTSPMLSPFAETVLGIARDLGEANVCRKAILSRLHQAEPDTDRPVIAERLRKALKQLEGLDLATYDTRRVTLR